jgi:hypothetical protein
MFKNNIQLAISILLVSVSGFSQSKTPQFEKSLRPEVYMGMCNLKDLANSSNIKKWTYVRENLNGIWVNGAATGKENIIKIVKSIKTRNALFIAPLSARNPFEIKNSFLLYYNALTDAGLVFNKPGLVLVNDYLSKKGQDPLRYYDDGDIALTDAYVNGLKQNKNGDIFGDRYYITTRHGPFMLGVYKSEKDPNNILIGKGYGTFLDAKGSAYERDAKELSHETKYKQSYIQAFNIAHENNKEFIWLCPRGNNGTAEELIQGLKDCYEWMEKNKVFPDKIVIINYSRKEDMLPMFPMLNLADENKTPATFTGALYWAIKQYEKNH